MTGSAPSPPASVLAARAAARARLRYCRDADLRVPLRNGHLFEVMQGMSDDPVSACEECGAAVERVFHPVAVHFKGSGFYTTDYAKKKAPAGSGDSGDSKGGDSKGESKSEGQDSKSESKSSDAKPATKSSSSSTDAGPRPRSHPEDLEVDAMPSCRFLVRSPGAAGRLLDRLAARQLLDCAAALALADEDAAAGAGAGVLLAEDVGVAAAAEDRRDGNLRQGQPAHVADEGPGRVPADPWALDEVVGQAQRVGEPALDPVQQDLLARGPVEVGLARVAVVLADSRQRQGLVTLEGVLARGSLIETPP